MNSSSINKIYITFFSIISLICIWHIYLFLAYITFLGSIFISRNYPYLLIIEIPLILILLYFFYYIEFKKVCNFQSILPSKRYKNNFIKAYNHIAKSYKKYLIFLLILAIKSIGLLSISYIIIYKIMPIVHFFTFLFAMTGY